MQDKRIYYFLLSLLILGGCYSVRKKFIRKKKSNTPPKVYVDFKEYPRILPSELYEDYYLFVNAWIDEMIEGLKGSFSYKRERHAWEEAVKNMKGMMDILDNEGKDKLTPLYEELLGLGKEISLGLVDTEKNYLLQKIESLRIRFEKNFMYSKVSQWIKRD